MFDVPGLRRQHLVAPRPFKQARGAGPNPYALSVLQGHPGEYSTQEMNATPAGTLPGQKGDYSIQPVQDPNAGYEPTPFAPARPNASGYLPQLKMPAAQNPWASQVGAQESALSQAMGMQAQLPNLQAGVAQQQSAMDAYGQSTQPVQNNYPSYPNEFGLGSQNPFGSPAATTPQPAPSASSRGFNPWSLTGEALSR